jgi:hypothetical protein
MKRQLIGDVLSSLIQDKEQSIYHSLTPTPILIQSHHASIGANIWTDYWDKTKKMSVSAQNKIKEWVVWAISIIDDSCRRVYKWLSSIKTSVLTNIPLNWLSEFTELANDMVSVSRDTLDGIFETFGRFIRRLFGKTFGLFKNVDKSVLYDAYQQLISLVKVPISLVGSVMIQPLSFIGEWLRDFIAPTLLQGAFKIVKTHTDIIMYCLHAMIRQDEPRVLRLMTLRERYFNEKICENIANTKHQVTRRVDILSDFCTEIIEIAQLYRKNPNYRFDGLSTRINWNVKSVWLMSLHNPRNSNPEPINSLSDFLWVVSDFLHDAVTENHETAVFYIKQIMEHPIYYHIGKLVYDNICTTLSPLEAMFNNKDKDEDNVFSTPAVHKKQGYTEERFHNIVNTYTRRLAVSQNPLVVQKLKDMREFLEAFKTTGAVEVSEEERTAWVEQYTRALKEHHQMMLVFRKQQRKKEEIAVTRDDLDELDDEELSDLLLVDTSETLALSIVRLDLLAMDGIRIKHNKYILDDLLKELIVTAERLVKVASFAPSKLIETVMPEKKEQRRPSKKKRQGRTELRYTDVQRDEIVQHLLDAGQIRKIYSRWVAAIKNPSFDAWEDEIHKATNALNDGYSGTIITIFDASFRVDDIKSLGTFQGRYGATYYYFLETYRRLYPLLQSKPIGTPQAASSQGKSQAATPQSSSDPTEGIREELLLYLSDVQMAFKQYDRIKELLNQNNWLFYSAAIFGFMMWSLETGMRASGRLKAVATNISPVDAKLLSRLSTDLSNALPQLRDNAGELTNDSMGFLLLPNQLDNIEPLLMMYNNTGFVQAAKKGTLQTIGKYDQAQLELALSTINTNIIVLKGKYEFLNNKTNVISVNDLAINEVGIKRLQFITQLGYIRDIVLNHLPILKKQMAKDLFQPPSKVEWQTMITHRIIDLVGETRFDTKKALPLTAKSVENVYTNLGGLHTSSSSTKLLTFVLHNKVRDDNTTETPVVEYEYLLSQPTVKTEHADDSSALVTTTPSSSSGTIVVRKPEDFFTSLYINHGRPMALFASPEQSKNVQVFSTQLKKLPIFAYYEAKQIFLTEIENWKLSELRNPVHKGAGRVNEWDPEKQKQIAKETAEQYSTVLDKIRYDFLTKRQHDNSLPTYHVINNDNKIVTHVCNFLWFLNTDLRAQVDRYNELQLQMHEFTSNIEETQRVQTALETTIESRENVLKTAIARDDKYQIEQETKNIEQLKDDLLRNKAIATHYSKMEGELKTYQGYADIVNLLSNVDPEMLAVIKSKFYSEDSREYRNIIDRVRLESTNPNVEVPKDYKTQAQRLDIAYNFMNLFNIEGTGVMTNENEANLMKAFLTFVGSYQHDPFVVAPIGEVSVDRTAAILSKLYGDDETLYNTGAEYGRLIIHTYEKLREQGMNIMDQGNAEVLSSEMVKNTLNTKNFMSKKLEVFTQTKENVSKLTTDTHILNAISRARTIRELEIIQKEILNRESRLYQQFNIFTLADDDIVTDVEFFKKFPNFTVDSKGQMTLDASVVFTDDDVLKLARFYTNTASVSVVANEMAEYFSELILKNDKMTNVKDFPLFAIAKHTTAYTNMLNSMFDVIKSGVSDDTKNNSVYRDALDIQRMFVDTTQKWNINATDTERTEVFDKLFINRSILGGTSIGDIDTKIDGKYNKSYRKLSDYLKLVEKAISALNDIGPEHQYNYYWHILRDVLGVQLKSYDKLINPDSGSSIQNLRDRVDLMEIEFLTNVTATINSRVNNKDGDSIQLDNYVNQIAAAATSNAEKIKAAYKRHRTGTFGFEYTFDDIKRQILESSSFFATVAIPVVDFVLSMNSLLHAGLSIYNLINDVPMQPITTPSNIAEHFENYTSYVRLSTNTPTPSFMQIAGSSSSSEVAINTRIGDVLKPLVSLSSHRTIRSYQYNIQGSNASWAVTKEIANVIEDFKDFKDRFIRDINELWTNSAWLNVTLRTEAKIEPTDNPWLDNLRISSRFLRTILAMLSRAIYTGTGMLKRYFSVLAAVPLAISQLQIGHFLLQCALGGTTALGWTEGVYDWEFDTYLSPGWMAISGVLTVLFMGFDRIVLKNTGRQALDNRSMDELGNVIFAKEPRLTGHEGPQMAWKLFRAFVGPITQYANGIQEWVFLPSTTISGSNVASSLITQSESSWIIPLNTSVPEVVDAVTKAAVDPEVITTIKSHWFTIINYTHWGMMGAAIGERLWTTRKQMQGTRLVDLLPTIYYNIVHYMQRFSDIFVPSERIVKHGSGKIDLTSATGILTHYGILWANQNSRLYSDLDLTDKLDNFVFIIKDPVSGVGSQYQYPVYVILMPDIINRLHTSQYTSNDFAKLKETLSIPLLSNVRQSVAVLHEILINEGAFVEQALRLAETPEQKYDFLLTIIAKYAGKYIIQNLIDDSRK